MPVRLWHKDVQQFGIDEEMHGSGTNDNLSLAGCFDCTSQACVILYRSRLPGRTRERSYNDSLAYLKA